ncbi:MAG: aromatic ring-hydroxylating dioxygenase subunit alpha [Ignavibacteria bacterium]|nr:aromatic ring-hydroxylating dioxygenase subunit alpha [Ignavibacteria bacterium]
MTTAYRKRGVDYSTGSMFTLSPEFYRSEEIYREEIDNIFYRRWLMVCREEEIPETGAFITVAVGDESIIVVRDDRGTIRAHFNVCRHRGTRICEREQGQFGSGDIQCPYHAWRYRLDGTLKAAPLMNETPSFDMSDYPLHSAHVGLWGGFVFISLAEDPVPFETEMAGLIGRFEEWHLPELRIAHTIKYELKCNWKLILQNYQECYHCPGVHPLLSKWTPFRGAVHDCMEGAVIGGYMEMKEPNGGMTMDGKPASVPVCDVSGENLRRVHYYSVFPNLLLSPHPDFVLYHRIQSVTIDRIRNDCFFLLHPDVIADGTKMERFRSAIEFWDKTNREDWHVCEQMQLGLRSRRFERGRYSGQEDILFALDREVLKALGRTPPSR